MSAIDGNAFSKDEVRNRTDTGAGRLGSFLLDAAVLFGIKCNGTRLIAVEAVVGCDVSQYIGIGDILRFDEVSVGNCYCESVLGVNPGSCQNHGMSGLSRIGPKLSAKIKSKPEARASPSGRAKATFGSVIP